MITPRQLLRHAQGELDRSGAKKPRQADLHRAASTAYYAVFHCLSQAVASEFVPAKSGAVRTRFARAVQHGHANEAARSLAKTADPDLRKFAATFAILHQTRTLCDYDLAYKISKRQVADAIIEAEEAIEAFDRANAGARKQFLADVLLKSRK